MGTYSLLMDFLLFKTRLKTSYKIFTTVISWLMDIWVCSSTLGSFGYSFNISLKMKKHIHPFLRWTVNLVQWHLQRGNRHLH